jgi:hypothetical protein
MRVASSRAFFSVALTTTVVGLACSLGSGCSSSSSSSSSSCPDYVPPASFDATTPTTFSKDVFPIFKLCAFSTCHGTTVGDSNGIFLGNDPSRVYTSIVNVRGNELPTMPFITPGNPDQSYLMHKIDGTQCAFDAQCAGSTCQDSMPKNESLLDVPTRDIIRRWITQGAKND